MAPVSRRECNPGQQHDDPVVNVGYRHALRIQSLPEYRSAEVAELQRCKPRVQPGVREGHSLAVIPERDDANRVLARYEQQLQLRSPFEEPWAAGFEVRRTPQHQVWI